MDKENWCKVIGSQSVAHTIQVIN